MGIAIFILLLLSVSTNVLGVIVLKFETRLQMLDLSVEETTPFSPFNPVLSHHYLSRYGLKPWVRQWCLVWAQMFGFCAKLLQWLVIPVSSPPHVNDTVS
jgi:hypothetical protein